MTALPNEMWLRIFSLMDSTKSLGCVVLVCRKFHMLATEALVRNITWRSSTVALKHLKFLEAEPSRTHLVRSLSLTLKSSQIDIDSDPEYIYIFGSIQSFSKLRHLKLSTGTVPDVLYRTLQNLPSLTQITFQACAIPPAPPFFPYSFPSTIPPAPIETTILSVSKLRPFHMGNFFLDAVTVPLAYHLPNLRTFVTDAIGIQIPTTASAQISSLTLNLPAVMSDIQPRLDVLLQRMPLLTDLTVSIAPSGNHPPHGTASTVSPGPAPPLPLLRTLSAPWPAAGHIVAGAPALEHLRVSSAIPKPGDAVWLLERLRAADAGAGLRSVALRLHTWDDEVLLAAARCLPACAVLEVAYQDGAPSDDFLFNLGIHHLPLLRALHTLRLYALPPPVDTAPLRFVWDPDPAPVVESTVLAGLDARTWFQNGYTVGRDEEGDGAGSEEDEDKEQREREEREEEEKKLRECVHAWARYNPELRRVQLGAEAGRAWVREAAGAARAWAVDEEDNEVRAEEWEMMCAAAAAVVE